MTTTMRWFRNIYETFPKFLLTNKRRHLAECSAVRRGQESTLTQDQIPLSRLSNDTKCTAGQIRHVLVCLIFKDNVTGGDGSQRLDSQDQGRDQGLQNCPRGSSTTSRTRTFLEDSNTGDWWRHQVKKPRSCSHKGHSGVQTPRPLLCKYIQIYFRW